MTSDADSLGRRRLPMLGDIVRPLPYNRATHTGHGSLRSGASWYTDAVVVQVSPFALTSREGDMLWSCTAERADFEVSGVATLAEFDVGRQRISLGLTNRRAKRERRKVSRRIARVEAKS